MEQDSIRLFASVPRGFAEAIERRTANISQLYRESNCRLENKSAMASNNGLAIEHAERIPQLELRRPKHELPIPSRYLPRSRLNDFTILSTEHGSPWYRTCTFPLPSRFHC